MEGWSGLGCRPPVRNRPNFSGPEPVGGRRADRRRPDLKRNWSKGPQMKSIQVNDQLPPKQNNWSTHRKKLPQSMKWGHIYLHEVLTLYKQVQFSPLALWDTHHHEMPRFDSAYLPLSCINNPTYTNSIRSSQVVFYPSTILAQCCLTSVYRWELEYTSINGCCHNHKTGKSVKIIQCLKKLPKSVFQLVQK